MARWVAIAAACFLLAVAIPVSWSTWYVREYARHSCAALEVLTSGPAPRSSQPQFRKFYAGLRYWEKADGCG